VLVRIVTAIHQTPTTETAFADVVAFYRETLALIRKKLERGSTARALVFHTIN
jgi:hypothetical protein